MESKRGRNFFLARESPPPPNKAPKNDAKLIPIGYKLLKIVVWSKRNTYFVWRESTWAKNIFDPDYFETSSHKYWAKRNLMYKKKWLWKRSQKNGPKKGQIAAPISSKLTSVSYAPKQWLNCLNNRLSLLEKNPVDCFADSNIILREGFDVIGENIREKKLSKHGFCVILLHVITSLCAIMGDFNLEMSLQNDRICRNFCNTLFSFYMNPSINICTQITETSATLIDNIFVNFNYKESCVIPNDVSDHCGIMTTYETNGFTFRSLRIDNERIFISKTSFFLFFFKG